MARTNILQNTQNIHLAKTRERASKEEESALHERTGYKGDWAAAQAERKLKKAAKEEAAKKKAAKEAKKLKKMQKQKK